MFYHALSIIARFLLVLFVFLPYVPAHAGDAVRGETIFKKCRACHVVEKPQNKTGPHLIDIFGRPAGSLDSYSRKYSKAIKSSGIIWDEETLDAYITAPRKYIKGGRMAFAGLKKPEDRADVIAYLRQFSQQ